ncbi:MAG TPA: DoxX family protein [Flavipsychrobacter sp.]|nr:DoxX family protein [Flavipsychrobacter sp.]
MKAIKITYWVATIIPAALFAMSSVMYLTHNPALVSGMKALGYPLYLLNILGTAKILGAIALVVPKFPRLKEWAYAGFVFDILGAIWSHLANRNFSEIPFIVFILLLVGISYFTYHRLQANHKLVII